MTHLFDAIVQQVPAHRGRHGMISILRHLGALGLLPLAILDSSPLPTFAGADLLTAIVAARHRNPWYEYALVATTGSVIGAYFTFRIARKAGLNYFHRWFKRVKLDALLNSFHNWGANALAVSTAVPFPFPTSVLFAAAGASDYSLRRFLTVVTLCRLARYAAISWVADYYGRHFIHILRHPSEEWRALLLLAASVFVLITIGMRLSKRLKPFLDNFKSESRGRRKAPSGPGFEATRGGL